MITSTPGHEGQRGGGLGRNGRGEDRSHDGHELVEELQGDGAEDSARDAPHAPDDEHAQIPDRIHEGKLIDDANPK